MTWANKKSANARSGAIERKSDEFSGFTCNLKFTEKNNTSNGNLSYTSEAENQFTVSANSLVYHVNNTKHKQDRSCLC